MKLTILFENKKLSLSLNSPVRVKELINEISKKLDLKNTRLNLFNPCLGTCYEEQDFILNSEDLELMLFTIKNLRNVGKKQGINMEDTIQYCTDAKDKIKKTSSYRSFSRYSQKYESQFSSGIQDMFMAATSGLNDQSTNSKSKITELMNKFEALKEIKKREKESIGNNPSESNQENNPNAIHDKITQYYERKSKLSSRPAAEKIEPDSTKLESLLCMGFEEDRCKKALVISKNNIEHATELLLGGSDFELYDQVNHNSVYDSYSGYHDLLNQGFIGGMRGPMNVEPVVKQVTNPSEPIEQLTSYEPKVTITEPVVDNMEAPDELFYDENDDFIDDQLYNDDYYNDTK